MSEMFKLFRISLLRLIPIIVVGFFALQVQAQDEKFDYFYILELTNKYQAQIIQNRFDKAIASNHYFECDSNKYCFELDEDDLELTFGLFNRKVIPKHLQKNITYYEIWTDVIGENGEQILLE